MATRLLCGMAAFALVSCTTGCTSPAQTFRGQTPANGVQNANYNGPRSMPVTPAQHCETCPQHGAACNGNGCYGGFGMMNVPFHPVHRNYYNVDMPRDLRYPAQNTSAVVQYPYYTTKGPSDFFLGSSLGGATGSVGGQSSQGGIF